MVCFAKKEGNHKGCPYVDSRLRGNDGGWHPLRSLRSASPCAEAKGTDASAGGNLRPLRKA